MEPAHDHVHMHEDYPLEPPEAFQLLSQFLSRPSPEGANEMRAFLPDIRAIAFYYRFLMDADALSDLQLTLVRQFIAQTYAVQQILRGFAND
jgi:hypothetical protein